MNSLEFNIQTKVLYGLSEKDLTEADKQTMIARQLIFRAESLFWFLSNHANNLAESNARINNSEVFNHFQNTSELGFSVVSTLGDCLETLSGLADNPKIKVPTVRSQEAANIIKSLNEFSNDFSLLSSESQRKAYRQFTEFWKNFKNTEVQE